MLPGIYAASWGYLAPRMVGLLLVVGLVGCSREDEAPPAAAAGTAVEANAPEGLELERAYPINAEDVGSVLRAHGTVLGKPQLDGFFLEAEGDRVLFIKSAQPVTEGQQVRAVGPLRIADLEIFEAWERDILGDTDATRLIQLFYIDATAVTPDP